jgi:hypothetical protein
MAQLSVVKAQTGAVKAKSQARRAASKIAAHSKSENFSTTDSTSDVVSVSESDSMARRRADQVIFKKSFIREVRGNFLLIGF